MNMQTNAPAGPALSAEQEADLRRLEAMAADGQPGPAPEMIEDGPVVDPAESWAVLPAIVGSTLAIAFPELRAVYSQEACRAWGAAMVPVAEKYGWEADALAGPEIGLLAASLPFIVGTVGAFKAKKAEQQKAEKASPAAKVKEQVDAMQKTVVFGAPVVGEPAE